SPRDRLPIDSQGAIDTGEHIARARPPERKPGRRTHRERGLISVHDGVGKTTDMPDNRNGAITQRVKLAQAAWLKAGRMKQHVGTGKERVRQPLFVADADRSTTGMMAGCMHQTCFDCSISSAKRCELHPPLQ